MSSASAPRRSRTRRTRPSRRLRTRLVCSRREGGDVLKVVGRCWQLCVGAMPACPGGLQLPTPCNPAHARWLGARTLVASSPAIDLLSSSTPSPPPASSCICECAPFCTGTPRHDAHARRPGAPQVPGRPGHPAGTDHAQRAALRAPLPRVSGLCAQGRAGVGWCARAGEGRRACARVRVRCAGARR